MPSFFSYSPPITKWPRSPDRGAVDQRAVPALAVAAEGLAIVELAAEPVELGVEQDVDHARDGVGTIGGRSAAGDGFDPLDHRGRDQVEIDRAAVRGRARSGAS